MVNSSDVVSFNLLKNKMLLKLYIIRVENHCKVYFSTSFTFHLHRNTNLNFTGRVIVVDWAIPKDKFTKPQPQKSSTDEIKDEPKDEERVTEFHSDDENSVKSEPISQTNEYESEAESDQVKSENEDEDESESEGSIDNEDYISIKKDDSVTSERARPKPSHDINEGKTVFLKNVPFDITNDELRAFMVEHVGPVYFAVVCIDPLTEHSRGTAFVKFKVIFSKNQFVLITCFQNALHWIFF